MLKDLHTHTHTRARTHTHTHKHTHTHTNTHTHTHAIFFQGLMLLESLVNAASNPSAEFSRILRVIIMATQANY